MVDLLHEDELGLEKDFSTQIVRIVEFLGPETAQTFNERYVVYPFYLVTSSSLTFPL